VSGVTAIVLAGSRPGTDPFAAEHGTDLKALIPVAGQPMVMRPVTALLGSSVVDRVHVLAQQPERIAGVLPADPRLTVAQSAGTIASTLQQLIDDPATRWPVLVTTADHALLTGDMIGEFVAGAEGADIAIAVVEKRSLLRRLPQSKRTWIAFRGGAYTGANLFLLRSSKVRSAVELWRAVEQDRKKGIRLLWALGPATLSGALLRVRSLDEVLERMGGKLGLTIRAIGMSDPIAAVDVDKAEDVRLAEILLRERA